MYKITYPDGFDGDASKLADYIVKTCEKHKKENRALAFAFIIADINNPHINQILYDKRYLNALHSISGNYLTIFFLNDDFFDLQISRAVMSDAIWVELGMQSIDAPPSITPKQLASVLTNRDNLPSPSVLFFQVDDGFIREYTIANLRENKIEEGFIEIRNIISNAVNAFDKVKDENKRNSHELFSLLKQSIESSEFWKKANNTYDKFIKIRDFVFFWRI